MPLLEAESRTIAYRASKVEVPWGAAVGTDPLAIKQSEIKPVCCQIDRVRIR